MSETMSSVFDVVKDGVFHFSRGMSRELERHDASPRGAWSLRTRSAKLAEARARRTVDELDEYWYHLRSRDAELPGKHRPRLRQVAGAGAADHRPALAASSGLRSEAGAICQRLKGDGRPVTLLGAADRTCGYVIDACGDKNPDACTGAEPFETDPHGRGDIGATDEAADAAAPRFVFLGEAEQTRASKLPRVGTCGTSERVSDWRVSGSAEPPGRGGEEKPGT